MDMRWKDTSLSFEERAEILVSQMTLEEKVSQMTYYSSALSRFRIPEYNWWNECLHGVARAGTATMFPQPIGMAASFDAPQLQKIAAVIADEARVKHHSAAAYGDRGIYKGLTMWTPNINIFRDPRWGRGHETYGEDPYLTSRLGVAFIKGLQGEDPKYYKCIATAKHYAVHSGPENERAGFDAVVSAKDLAETYLPAFRAAVQEGEVQSVMGAYNRVNGEASCASPTLLQKILREQWGFDGYVVSDCGAIENIHVYHKLAGNETEAAALAVNNGCDLCCGFIFPHLLDAVAQGLISEETITQSARRLLLARFMLGMFDPEEEQAYAALPYALNDCDANHALSRTMAQDSLVLLKNDGILPLTQGKIKTVAVIGPNADSRAALIGNYAGTPSETYTIYEGLRQHAPEIRWIYAEGCTLSDEPVDTHWGVTSTFRLAEAQQAAAMADVCIVVTGLTGEKEGEKGYGSGDRTTMLLPESQRMLMETLATMHKPMILVNMTGSPTIFPHEEAFSAIVQAWYPGQMGGMAVADVLFGDVSPSGRLPVTFYRDMEQVPPITEYAMKGRTYRYLEDAPAYPFGYGLSYTDFAYSDMVVSRVAEGLSVSAVVTNTGRFAGKEIAQVYLRWIAPAHATPVVQLSAFEAVSLSPGEAKPISLLVREEQLGVYDDDGILRAHDGEVQVYIGGSQPDARSVALTGVAPLTTIVKL